MRAKVWLAGTAEPGSWGVSATDSTPSMQAVGSIGVFAYLSPGTANAPIQLALRGLDAVRPIGEGLTVPVDADLNTDDGLVRGRRPTRRASAATTRTARGS